MTEKTDDHNDASRQSHRAKRVGRAENGGGFRPPGNGAGASTSAASDSVGDAAASFRRQLEDHGARTIQLAWSDLLGLAGGVIIPAADHQRAIAGASLPAGVLGRQEALDAVADMRTLRFLPTDGSTAASARLICDLRLPGGEASALCPRTCLRRTVDALQRSGLNARASLDYRLQAGARSGIELLAALQPAVADMAFCRVAGLTFGFAENIEGASIGVGPLPPVDAADTLQLLRDVLNRALLREGVRVSLAVRSIGLTLHHGKRNLFTDQPVNRGAAAAFLSGTRVHAAGLTALLRPMLSGADTVAVPPDSPRPAPTGDELGWRWERGWATPLGIHHLGGEGSIVVTGLDGSGSLHLMLAGLIAAGLDGMRHAGGTGGSGGAGTADPARGSIESPPLECPPDPGLALAALISDECLRDALGAPTVDAYAASLRQFRERHWMPAQR